MTLRIRTGNLNQHVSSSNNLKTLKFMVERTSNNPKPQPSLTVNFRFFKFLKRLIMESIPPEDSMNSSSEEDNQPDDQDNSDTDAGDSRSTGRPYECLFCKRGFGTAQALGGHMNIHRKERAKNRAVSVNSDKNEEIYNERSGIYRQIRSIPPGFSDDQKPPVTYRTYIPASTSVAEPSYAQHNNNGFCYRNPKGFNPVGDHDWRLSLSLQFGPSHKEDKYQKIEFGSEEEEDELDLELRLGHNP